MCVHPYIHLCTVFVIHASLAVVLTDGGVKLTAHDRTEAFLNPDASKVAANRIVSTVLRLLRKSRAGAAMMHEKTEL